MADPYRWDERDEAWEEVAASEPFQLLRDKVCERAGPRRDDQVVDLGAGTGLIALSLAPFVAHMTAVDLSPRMLERLDTAAVARGITNITPVVGDLRALPLDDESVSLAVSNYAYHHLQDADKELALTEVRRVLAPGGRFVLCDMMFALSLQQHRTLLWHKLVAIARRGPAGLVRIARNAGRLAAGRWEHPSSCNAWEEMLKARRFVDVHVETLANEAGLATARRPVAVPSGTGPPAVDPVPVARSL